MAKQIFGAPAQKEPEYELMSGVFQCQRNGCYKMVYEARYFPIENMLLWKCEDQHKSFIEEFM